jgi:S-adenosyl-L-methionine hydrolase (adenosine-forming)
VSGRRVITFMTDFGLMDDFVGTCHGVIKRIAPDAEIIDITHGIAPQSVLEGALVLAKTLPYMPEGIHIGVVDPGVGSDRRAVALRDAAGRLYIGPDNGLLVPAAEAFGGIVAARELVNAEYWLDRVSRTFHGRDIFAPVAAHLALGVDLERLGPELDPGELVRLELPEPSVGTNSIRGRALGVDRFGNVQLNLSRRHLERVGIVPGARVELEHATDRYYAIAARTFSDVRPGEIVLYEDAYENVSIAITSGSAAETLSASAGDEVRIRVAD